MSTEKIREVVARLAASSNALIALALAIQSQASSIPSDSTLQLRIDEVLNALGVLEFVRDLAPSEAVSILAGIRADILIGAKLIGRDPSRQGWTHDEPELLQAFGDVSAGFPALLKAKIAPQLEGLSDRLSAPGAAFLDIGVGVGALSLAMVRQWPSLRIVGVEPWSPAFNIAKQNVQKAGLGAQIELREVAGEHLSDTNAFDLGWVPTAFIEERLVPKIVKRVARALRPGGWLLLAMVNPGADPLPAAISRFRTTVWGGSLLSAKTVTSYLVDAGLMDVHSLPGPAGSPILMIAGRREV